LSTRHDLALAWTTKHAPPYLAKDRPSQKLVAQHVLYLLREAELLTEEIRSLSATMTERLEPSTVRDFDTETVASALAVYYSCGRIDAACGAISQLVSLRIAEVQRVAGVDAPEAKKKFNAGIAEQAMSRICSRLDDMRSMFEMLDLNLRAALDDSAERRPIEQYDREGRTLYLAGALMDTIEQATTGKTDAAHAA
jgi:hypothetical protein